MKQNLTKPRQNLKIPSHPGATLAEPLTFIRLDGGRFQETCMVYYVFLFLLELYNFDIIFILLFDILINIIAVMQISLFVCCVHILH